MMAKNITKGKKRKMKRNQMLYADFRGRTGLPNRKENVKDKKKIKYNKSNRVCRLRV